MNEKTEKTKETKKNKKTKKNEKKTWHIVIPGFVEDLIKRGPKIVVPIKEQRKSWRKSDGLWKENSNRSKS